MKSAEVFFGPLPGGLFCGVLPVRSAAGLGLVRTVASGSETVSSGDGARVGPSEDRGGALVGTIYVDDSDRKSTRLNSSHSGESRMPSSA